MKEGGRGEGGEGVDTAGDGRRDKRKSNRRRGRWGEEKRRERERDIGAHIFMSSQ